MKIATDKFKTKSREGKSVENWTHRRWTKEEYEHKNI